VCVGAGYAGVSCAVRLARRTRGTGTSVALVDPRPYFVERIRLHEDVAGEVRRRARIRGRDEAFDEIVNDPEKLTHLS
jgi:NADH dehydrogenase